MQEWMRLEQLLGVDNVSNLQTKTIVVIGVGGVGGYTVESLTRMGIGTLILIDYDVIELSNMNRQLIALHSTIGKKKVIVWKERIYDMNPKCNVIIYDLFLTKENIGFLNDYQIDYIIDACDTISTKQAIIAYAISHQIPVLSCMGTGNKMDPTKMEIIELRKTSYDPIAKKLRKWVKEEKIREKIMVVCSKESPVKSKIVASNSFVPGVAGLLCTSYVIHDLISR